jgi:hypothetical protein
MQGDPTAESTLGEIEGWWISTRCPCGRMVLLPCKMLARDRSPRLRAGDVARRLRCAKCGERVASAELVDNPQGDAQGYVGGTPPRRVPLPLG